MKPLLATCLAGVAVLLFACLPEMTGWACHGRAFLGVPNSQSLLDNLVYVEMARNGAAGQFLPPNLHTAEAGARHPQCLTLPLAAGWVMARLGLPVRLFPFVTKVVFGALLLVFLGGLARRVMAPGERVVGLAHLWLGAGLFWALDLPSLARGEPVQAYLDRQLTLQLDHSSYFAFYGLGHLALALVLLVGCLWALFLRERPFAARAAGCAALLAVVHPYDLLIAAAVGGCMLLVSSVRERGMVASRLTAAAIAGAAALPGAVFHYWYSYRSTAGLQMDAHWLGPADYVWSFGQPLLLAGYYVVKEVLPRRRGPDQAGPGLPPDTALWLCWLAVAPLLLFNPYLFFRRKLALGLCVPIAILGARGALLLARTCVPARARPAVLALLTAAACLTPVDVTLRDAVLAARGNFPQVLPADTQQVLEYLSSGVSGVVLAEPPFLSQLAPALAGRKVFQGWSIFVLDVDGKTAARKAFLAPGTAPEARRGFLASYGITEVVLPRDLCETIGADGLPFLTRQASFGGYTVYRVSES